MTREAIHQLAYDDAIRALELGSPSIKSPIREAIALNFAVRLSHHLVDVLAKERVPT